MVSESGEVKFLKVKNAGEAAKFVASVLEDHLKDRQSILWLVPGGSAMEVAYLAANRLAGAVDGGSLTISLTDERYGPPEHPDSNWRQLADMGFSLKGAEMRPVLTGRPLFEEADEYSRMLNNELENTDYSLALGGMGADGHIFGIKPGGPALDDSKDAVGYIWDDYQRLTPTARFFRKLDEIIMYVMGGEKHHQLEMLSQDINPEIQPAQLLKTMKKVIILNDWKGEEI